MQQILKLVWQYIPTKTTTAVPFTTTVRSVQHSKSRFLLAFCSKQQAQAVLSTRSSSQQAGTPKSSMMQQSKPELSVIRAAFPHLLFAIQASTVRQVLSSKSTAQQVPSDPTTTVETFQTAESVQPARTVSKLVTTILRLVRWDTSVLKAASTLLFAHAVLIIQKQESTIQETARSVTRVSTVPSSVKRTLTKLYTNVIRATSVWEALKDPNQQMELRGLSVPWDTTASERRVQQAQSTRRLHPGLLDQIWVVMASLSLASQANRVCTSELSISKTASHACPATTVPARVALLLPFRVLKATSVHHRTLRVQQRA